MSKRGEGGVTIAPILHIVLLLPSGQYNSRCTARRVQALVLLQSLDIGCCLLRFNYMENSIGYAVLYKICGHCL